MFVADTLTFLYVVLANTRGGNPSWIWTSSWQGPPPISGSRTTLTPVGTETLHLSDTFHNDLFCNSWHNHDSIPLSCTSSKHYVNMNPANFSTWLFVF